VSATSWAGTFPLEPAGGLFIFIMGAGVILGALFPGRRRTLLFTGAALATIAVCLSAYRLSAPFGPPRPIQLWFLPGAIAVEAVLIRLAVARYRNAGERSLLLAILFAVGLHFLPMAVAFGPICAALGLVLCVSAGVGLWLRPAIRLNTLWAMDGLIKMCFGALMFLAP
jgi:hypothetical protein